MTHSEIIGMTVKDLIEKTNLKVKLGAKNGSAFIFCGNIKSINCDTLDTEICDMYQRNINKAIASIESLKNKPKNYSAYKDEMQRK